MTSPDERHVLHALGQLMTESRAVVLSRGEGDLRPSQHRVIGQVPRDGISVTDLADRVGMTKQGIGQFVTQLTASGHLTVSPHPSDGRIRVVRRTAKGDDAERRLGELLEDLEAEWANRVGTQRYEAFRETLEEIAGERGQGAVTAQVP